MPRGPLDYEPEPVLKVIRNETWWVRPGTKCQQAGTAGIWRCHPLAPKQFFSKEPLSSPLIENP